MYANVYTCRQYEMVYSNWWLVISQMITSGFYVGTSTICYYSAMKPGQGKFKRFTLFFSITGRTFLQYAHTHTHTVSCLFCLFIRIWSRANNTKWQPILYRTVNGKRHGGQKSTNRSARLLKNLNRHVGPHQRLTSQYSLNPVAKQSKINSQFKL